MSNAHDHDAHAHGGADHVPHILPLGVYFKTYGALLFLTAITVGVSYVHLGDTGNLIVAMFVATIKASVVALIFMHLFWDQKFFAIIFSSSLLFLAIFLAFTMFDTNARGIADPVEVERPVDYKVPFGGTQSDQAYKVQAEETKKEAAAALAKMPPGSSLVPVVVPAPAVGTPAAPTQATVPAPGAVPPGATPTPGGGTTLSPSGTAPSPGALPTGASPSPPGTAQPVPAPGTVAADPAPSH